MTYEDIERYESANVAMRFLAQKDLPNVAGALEKLAEDFGKGEEYKGFIDIAMSSERGIKQTTLFYGNKFGEAINSANIGELYEKRYAEILQEYAGENLEKYNEIFNSFAGETYGDIMKKFMQAKKILDDKTDLFGDEQKKEAEGTLEKYKALSEILELVEEAKFESLRQGVVKKNLAGKFENYFKNPQN